MEGVVKFVNEEMYLCAVETDNGFTVYEFMDTDYVEPGDVVSGALESNMCSKLFRLPLRINFTTGAFFSECSCWKMVGRI
jgi:hypothetical protein